MATSEINTVRFLDTAIGDILCVINPSKDDWSARFFVIKEIQDVVRSVESLRGALVQPYGSFVSNLFSKEGDLDISIDLQHGSFISSPGKKQKQSLLKDLSTALRKKGQFLRVQCIPNARVPILKLDTVFNISCDISVCNLSGEMKSIMLYWINEIDGRFRDLVKEWAKTHQINDSRNGSFNSYSLTLLVIFHLQTLEPAILPPLKEIYPGNMSETLTGERNVAVKNVEDICAVNIKRIKMDKSRWTNRSSLSHLFISFLAKLSEICCEASTKGISPFAGQSEDISSNTSWQPKTYAVFVEDPFEQPANTARTVNSKQLEKILEAIKSTQAVVLSANHHRDDNKATVTTSSFLSVSVAPNHNEKEAVPRRRRMMMPQNGSKNVKAAAAPSANTGVAKTKRWLKVLFGPTNQTRY
ncbi:hypothetical protein M569_06872 [Genlisea aurea]|uniref:Poly(A) RNA polymerase mitochondrial-like central palm domain-containing protein n=1 Tax=Genlisea aurea TaxID=192259 RepID=S8CL95_9LAMI|nr:hypothetical protein M569_06872 [Genlisea aurea]